MSPWLSAQHEPYHLLNGLTSCADLFDKFGGHSHAAGITLKRDRIAELRRRLNQHAAAHLSDEDLQPCLYIDAELPTDEISFELVAQLNALEPYGAGNSRPTFLARNLCIAAEPRLIGERHLKLHVRGPQGRPLETIWWNGAEKMGALKMAWKWSTPLRRASGMAKRFCSCRCRM